MGNTPVWTIPYPEDADVVRQGAQAMKALALKVDGLPLGGSGSLVRTAAMSIANNTATPITWSGINAPQSGGIVVSTTAITVPVAGLYIVDSTVHWDAIATGARTIATLVNGALVAGDVGDARPTMGTAGRTICDIHRTYRLAAGDQVGMQGLQTSGVSMSILFARLDVNRTG